MRTNTWLGLLVFGQAVESYAARRQQQRLSEAQREQVERIAEAQAKRDQVRDESFDSAMRGLHRGQFAMWIQTPDGSLYENWSHHAMRASQALDDRQDAWELAFAQRRAREQDQAQRERERQHQEALDQYVAEHFVPTKRGRRGLWGKFMIVALAISLIGFIGMSFVEPHLPPVGSPYEMSVILFLIMVFIWFGAGVAALGFGIAWWTSPKDPELNDQKQIEQIKNSFPGITHGTPADAAVPSWHDSAEADGVRQMSLEIGTTASDADKIFPRKEQLLPLAGSYRTRTDLDVSSLPDHAARLLEGFQKEDAERRAELESADLR